MSSNTKTLAATFAVALMVCVSLIPLTPYSSSGDEASTGQGNESVSISSIIEKLSNIGSDESLVISDLTFVPTDDGLIGEEMSLTESIKETKYVDGETLVIGASNAYVFGDGTSAANDGKIVVKETGKIVFCPIDDKSTDNGFSLENNNKSCQDIIVLESGSTISVFGMSFKVYCGGTETARNTVSAIFLTVGGKVTFTSSFNAEKYSFGYDILDGKYMRMTIFGVFDSHEGTAFHLNNCDVSLNDGTLSFQNVIADISIKDGRYSYVLKDNADSGRTCSFSLSVSSEPSDDESTVIVLAELSVDLNFDEVSSYFQGNPQYKLTGISLDVPDVSMTFTNVIKDTGEFKREISTHGVIACTQPATISAEKVEMYTNVDLLTVTVLMENVSVTAKNVVMTFDDKTDASVTAERELLDLNIGMDVDMTADKISSVVPLTFWDVKITEVKDFAIDVNGVATVYDYENKIMLTEINDFVITGQALPQLVVDAKKIELAVVLDDFTVVNAFGLKDKQYSFNAVADLSVEFDGIERHLAVNLGDLVYTIYSDESQNTCAIKSLVLRNEIPFSKVTKTAEQDLICDITMSDVSITATGGVMTIACSSMDAQCNTIVDGIADTVGVSIGSDFELLVSETSVEIDASLIEGFLKNVGEDKEQFTIQALSQGAPVKVTVSKSDMPYFTWAVDLDDCKAVFGKGLLPAELTVGSNATFRANGLSAFDFVFETGSVLSGTVTFDLSDKLIYAERKIVSGTNTLTLKTTGDKGEYALTMDISDMTGTVDAKNGFKISGTSGDKSKTVVFDQSMTLENVCESMQNYYVYSDSEYRELPCGSVWKIDLTEPVKTDCKFIGWSDGGTTIYKTGDEYTMPAKNVTFTPVFAEQAKIEEQGGQVIAYAEDSQSVEISGSTIVGNDVVVVVENASVVIDSNTLSSIGVSSGKNLVVTMMPVTELDDSMAKVAGSNAVYSISLEVDGKTLKTSDYNNATFTVTVNVAVKGNVEDFKVSYMDDLGHLSEVNVDGYEMCDDGTYNVTFTTNHFSNFLIEPVTTSSEIENIPAIVVVLIATLLAAMVVVTGYGYKDDMKH